MMHKYDFDTVVDRKDTYSLKWDKLPQGNKPGALPLWVADMDFPCSKPIIDALHQRADRLIYGYTLYDSPELKNAVVNWFQKRHGWTVPANHIFYCPGIVPATAFLLNMLSDEGDGIIIQRPVYYPFTLKIEANNRKVINNPLIYNNGKYTIDYGDLDKKLSVPSTKGLILCNPHNPVGRVWTEEELKKVVEIAKKHHKWIISDEIHGDLVRKGIKFTPLEKVAPEYKDEIITCTAPSKSFNLAGMQISNIVINKPEYKEGYQSMLTEQYSLGFVNPFSAAATIAAYNESEDWLDQVNGYIDSNVDYCMEFFKKELPKSIPVYIEGTYLFWVDLTNYCKDPQKLEELMQQKADVALDEGYIFGDEGAGFERINVACPRSLLADCLERMRDALLTLDSL